ncbi:MAG TPA: polysaccharide deacetylase [Solirubrobacterales bacterium]
MSPSRPTVCLTFDFDAMSSWVTSGKSNNPSMISRGELSLIGIPRILALLRDFDAKGSFFVPGHTILAFPQLIEAIAADGHELGHHGWGHENPADFDRAGEEKVLELGIKAHEKVVGKAPTGYRSPAWDLSKDSVDLLLAHGFAYESSCMGSDFTPYYLRSGDRWSTTEPYVFGATTELIEMPVSWLLDDFPHFELIPGLFAQMAEPEKVFGTWREEFDFMAASEPDGALTLTMHPECTGRGARIEGLRRLLEHMAGAGAEFKTVGEVAAGWREANPLEEWKAANPLRTGADARNLTVG